MKKLIVTAIGAAAAFGAFATDVSTQRFKEVAVGEKTVSQLDDAATPAATGTGYWYDAGEAASNNTYTVTNATGLTCPFPFNEAPGNALSITTEFGTPLGVNIKDGGTTQNIGTGFYFDSLVKFTVCDDDQSADYNNAKIAMWLQENTDPEDDTIVTTNIMVKAGYLYLDNLGDVAASGVVYKCSSVDTSFAESWHRVTIKTIPDIDKAGRGVPGFVIFIDGSGENGDPVNSSAAKMDNGVLTPTDVAAYYLNGLFPSMDQSAASKSTLTAVEYAGTGSLTDLKFTDVAPAEFAEDPVFERAPATITVDSGEVQEFANIGELMAAVNAVAGGSTVAIDFTEGTTLAAPLVFTTAANVILDFKGFIITNTQEFAAITNSAATLVITNSTGFGGILCTGTATALDALGGTTTITDGMFDGNITATSTDTLSIVGGYFRQTYAVLGAYLPEGKALYFDQETGLYKYGDYIPEEFVVTFDANGGDLTCSETTNVIEGGYVVKPTNPTYDGHKFVGWFYDDDEDPETEMAPYPFGEEAVWADLTLVAQWEEDSWNTPKEDTPAAVKDALEADGFTGSVTNIVTTLDEFTNFVNYVKTQTGAATPSALTEAQKANAPLCYALQSSTIPATEIVDDDVTIESIEKNAENDAAVDIVVAIDGVTAGDDVPQATLEKIVTAKGGTSLGAMSAANVEVSGHATEDGKVNITVTPAGGATPTSFFTQVIINK